MARQPSSKILSAESGPLRVTNYLYDGLTSIEGIDHAGNELVYTQGTGNQPVADLRPELTSSYQGGLNSVTSLTTSTTALGRTYNYDAFGNLTPSTGISSCECGA